LTTVTPTWIDDIKNSYSQDTDCLNLIAQGTAGTTLPKKYTFHAGILSFNGRIVVGADNLLKNKLMDTIHSSPMGGHSGIRASYQRIKHIFYWPNLKRDVEKFIQ
jgi:hypothetical protein